MVRSEEVGLDPGYGFLPRTSCVVCAGGWSLHELVTYRQRKCSDVFAAESFRRGSGRQRCV